MAQVLLAYEVYSILSEKRPSATLLFVKENQLRVWADILPKKAILTKILVR